jgi:hypothetical protein
MERVTAKRVLLRVKRVESGFDLGFCRIVKGGQSCRYRFREPGKYAQPELRLTAERLESEVTNTAPSISEQDEGTKAVDELPRIEATTDGKANAPQPDQIEPTGDEETNVPALLANTSAVAEVSSSWEAGASGLIAGVLAIVLRACAAVILRRDNRIACTKGQALQPRAIFIEAPALPMTGRALSPDAALARIEEIRRSLLDLTFSPTIAPSATAKEAILPTAAAEPRLREMIVLA